MKRIFISAALLLSCFSLSLCTRPVKENEENKLSSSGPSGKYILMPNVHKQTIWGIGFEIQCDAIGSGNNGLPEEPIAVPHDLVQSERDRLANEMLQGFRYCRIAGGLYWRGLDTEKKHLQPRWREQLEEIKQMLEVAGVEGVSLEYWSPAPYWKANLKYFGNGKDDL